MGQIYLNVLYGVIRSKLLFLLSLMVEPLTSIKVIPIPFLKHWNRSKRESEHNIIHQ